MKVALPEDKGTVQSAIDFTFPLTSRTEYHAIFMDQLLKAYTQANRFIDSFLPLFKMAKSGDMDTKEGWNRAQVYAMSIFEDIMTVRHV